MQVNMINRKEIKKKLCKKSILLVDDDETLLESLHEMLSRYFERVVVANTGEEGFSQYKFKKTDIVLTDISMPVMNGIKMAKDILEYDNQAKIIFATGHSKEEYEAVIVELGGVILVKPISTEILLNTLVDLVDTE